MWDAFRQATGRRRLAGLFAAAWLVGFAATAQACEVRVDQVQAPTITYDPFTASPVGNRLRVAATVPGDDGCTPTIALTDAAGAPLTALRFDTLIFRLELVTSAEVERGSEPATAILRARSDGGSVTAEWLLVPTDETVLPPGDYSARVAVAVRAPDSGSPAAPAAIVVRSIPRAQLNLAGAAAGFAGGADTAGIDLGDLHPGAAGRVFVQVRANTNAQVTFTSANHGLLRSAGVASEIPYDLRFDGQLLDLASVQTRTVRRSTALAGDAYELRAEVGEFPPAQAGRYSDIVTIDISP